MFTMQQRVVTSSFQQKSHVLKVYIRTHLTKPRATFESKAYRLGLINSEFEWYSCK